MNSSEFKVAVTRSGITNRQLANSMGISEQALYHKISGRSEFKNSEIKVVAETLKLSMEEVNTIFFDSEVN